MKSIFKLHCILQQNQASSAPTSQDSNNKSRSQGEAASGFFFFKTDVVLKVCFVIIVNQATNPEYG